MLGVVHNRNAQGCNWKAFDLSLPQLVALSRYKEDGILPEDPVLQQELTSAAKGEDFLKIGKEARERIIGLWAQKYAKPLDEQVLFLDATIP